MVLGLPVAVQHADGIEVLFGQGFNNRIELLVPKHVGLSRGDDELGQRLLNTEDEGFLYYLNKKTISKDRLL